ncbi:MAG: GC-type dockerin domain-anchored protein [Planctomycetota bacterium]
MPLRTPVRYAAIALFAGASANAQELVGPTDAWFGIDKIEITYSGGTALFDVRFDQRSFDEAFAAGMPLPFTTEADVMAAFSAMDGFLSNPMIFPSQVAPIVLIPGATVLDDGFALPLEVNAGIVTRFGQLDHTGPIGWRYNERIDATISQSEDMIVSGEPNLAWAVFTLSPDPCVADFFPADGDGVLNFFDVSAYITAYNAASPDADLAAPFGTLNFFDIAEYIALYGAGCP